MFQSAANHSRFAVGLIQLVGVIFAELFVSDKIALQGRGKPAGH